LKNLRPLFLKQVDVTLPGLQLKRLRLNRHLSETTSVRSHSHAFSQVLLYLGGRGLQHVTVNGIKETHPIRSGATVFMPTRVPHAFSETDSRHPLCLVLDLEWQGAVLSTPRFAQLNLVDLNDIRHLLSLLGRHKRPGVGPDQLRAAGLVLQLLDVLWRNLGLSHKEPGVEETAPSQPAVAATRRVLRESPDDLPLSEVAKKVGYQHDYLNRLLKASTGLSLGQMRSQQRVARAQRLLKEHRKIARVSEELGFEDPNYFSRWFRLQTGLTPRQWQRNNAGSAAG
jgi:AraC family transcriptional activator of pobA